MLNDRYYWPSMYNYITVFSKGYETCQKTKSDTSPPKAPLVQMYIPQAPMEFLSIDIAYLPKDTNGYQYILLIGDVFSKFMNAVPLKDQTVQVIVDALLKNWIHIHGNPLYLLSDQGSSVDGETMKEMKNAHPLLLVAKGMGSLNVIFLQSSFELLCYIIKIPSQNGATCCRNLYLLLTLAKAPLLDVYRTMSYSEDLLFYHMM